MAKKHLNDLYIPSILDIFDEEPQELKKKEQEAPADSQEEQTSEEEQEADEEAPAEAPKDEATKKKRQRKSQERAKAEIMSTLSQLRLSAKRGEKLHRINMAFTADNYEYMSLMASIRNETMTDFINTLLTVSRLENSEIVEKAKEIKEIQLKEMKF